MELKNNPHQKQWTVIFQILQKIHLSDRFSHTENGNILA